MADFLGTRTCKVYDPLTDEWVYIGNLKTDIKSMPLYAAENALYAFDCDSKDASDIDGNVDVKNLDLNVYHSSDNMWSCGEYIPFSQDWDLIMLTNCDTDS